MGWYKVRYSEELHYEEMVEAEDKEKAKEEFVRCINTGTLEPVESKVLEFEAM